MFNLIQNVLTSPQIAELRTIAQTGQFVDGRETNPHNVRKKNEHLSEQDRERFQRSGQLIAQALYANEEFRNFAFPLIIAPPRLTTYRMGMTYGAHADAAFMPMNCRLRPFNRTTRARRTIMAISSTPLTSGLPKA